MLKCVHLCPDGNNSYGLSGQAVNSLAANLLSVRWKDDQSYTSDQGHLEKLNYRGAEHDARRD